MSRTILVVDDEDQVREILHSLLSSQGYRVLEADCGEQALTVSAGEDVSLVITDLKMPGMGGLELAGRLLDQDPDRPVIILTGHADLEVIRQAAEMGVRQYLAKPFRFAELLGCVENAIEKQEPSPSRS